MHVAHYPRRRDGNGNDQYQHAELNAVDPGFP